MTGVRALDVLRQHLTKLAADPAVRAVSRWIVGMTLANLLVTYGYVGILLSPGRSVVYRAFGRLPPLIHGNFTPDVGLVAPRANRRSPRWLWFALVGWWLGWLCAVFVAWPLLAHRRTVPLAFRVFAALDAIVFLRQDPQPTQLIHLDRHAMPAIDDEAVNGRERVPSGVRFQVLQRDGFRCQYCGRSPVDSPSVRLHLDHRKPVARGGTNDPDNLVTACSICNLGKGARFDTSHPPDNPPLGVESTDVAPTEASV